MPGPPHDRVPRADVKVFGDIGWRGHGVQVGKLGARVQPGLAHLFGEAAPGLIFARDASGAFDGRDLLDERAAAVLDADQALGAQQRDGPVDRGLVQVVPPGKVGLAGQRRARRVLAALDRVAECVGHLAVARMRRLQSYHRCRSGKLHSIKDGGMRFITIDALCDYVRQLENQADKVA